MIKVLANSILCRGFADADLASVEPYCRHSRYRSGDVILHQNYGVDRDLYLVYGGAVEIGFRDDQHPDDVITKEEIPAGEDVLLLGEISWLRRKAPTATVRCITDVEAVVVDGRGLNALMEREPRLGMKIMTNIAVLLADRLANDEMIIKLMLSQLPSDADRRSP